ncbi:MAG: amino acid adenylation domain-containing protein [Blautia sp.]|nr:amino acid adenylation domain-containing protein [Eubacteriales bacterium]MED9968104.1 amino acid adenylation domain-containing protein [Blautia sp.]
MKTNILEYLEGSSKRFPDKTAFADEHSSCTFLELEMTARRIGTALAKYFVPRNPVPVFMEKSVETIGVFMGAVYAGCFYVLIDTKQPASRLNQILEILDSEVIVTSEKYLEDLEKLDFKGEVVLAKNLAEEPENKELLKEIRNQAVDMDPLYGIFTSGSTGVPKGVVVGHRSVLDFIDCFTELFDISEKDVIGNQAPWDFDVSVKDIYSGLKTGATVQIIPKQMFSFPTKLIDYLIEREVTTLIWAVSALCIISTLNGFEYKVPDKIKKILFSGEAMPVKHLNIWRKYLPDVMYVNIYGPTEITCNCTYYIIDREFQLGDVLPMGKAFPNEKVFLLDEENRLITEKNKTGELCVTGSALALGYYKNREQTEKAFVQNPLNDRYLEMMYRTGDLAYYNDLGELCFASRKDFQIKHMGHRIELGEIEAAMEKIPEIIRSCCIFDSAKSKIVAFYEGDIERRPLARALGQYVPAFMVPNVFRQVERMPLTKNGKIDRKALTAAYQEEKK